MCMAMITCDVILRLVTKLFGLIARQSQICILCTIGDFEDDTDIVQYSDNKDYITIIKNKNKCKYVSELVVLHATTQHNLPKYKDNTYTNRNFCL